MIGPSLPPGYEIADDDDEEDSVASRIDPSNPWSVSDTLSSQSITRNKRLKGVAKLTPWIDAYEFEQVGQSLLSAARSLPLNGNQNYRKRRRGCEDGMESTATSDQQQLCQSLHRLSMWKVRMGDRMPHAVESSYQLALCLWNDYCSTISATYQSTSVESLRLSYSSAILRTINGLADAMQQQSVNAQSVAMLCADIGIPTWLVDVRHEAAHNQMPSLNVLRLAATTLLEFLHQDYWKPRFPSSSSSSIEQQLLQHLEAYKQQQARTMANRNSKTSPAKRKNNSSSSSSKMKRKTGNKRQKPVEDQYQGGDEGQMSDEEEMYLDGSNTDFWAGSSREVIGTNTNRFAALMMDKPKKKKKQPQPAASPKPSNNKKHNKRHQQPQDLSANHHAKQFVKKGMHHLEEAYRVALLFLVWGGIGDIPSGEGALIPIAQAREGEDEELFPQTDKGIGRLRHCYSLLLSAVGTEWPGFLKSLMIHLVDLILSLEQQQQQHEQSQDDDRAGEAVIQRKLFFLESWVRYLVSGEFLAQVLQQPNAAIPKDMRTKNPAPWQYLEKMWYPLNSLCDRLQHHHQSRTQEEECTSQRLTDMLVGILGSHRVVNLGLPDNSIHHQPRIAEAGEFTTDAEGDEDMAQSTTPTTKESIGNADSKSGLALHEMEFLLFADNKGKAVAKEDAATAIAASTDGSSKTEDKERVVVEDAQSGETCQSEPPKRQAWVRCTVWEPSAIGALPGYPFSG